MDKKLQKAVEKGDASTVSRLISGGAKVTGEDKKGNTLLHIAALSGSVENCVILVASGCNPKARNRKGETAYNLVEGKKKLAKVQQYLKDVEEQESKKAAETAAAAASAPTPTSIAAPSGGLKPRSVSSLVNILTYDIAASNWVPIAEDAQLSLNFTANPFGFTLSAPASSGGFAVNDQLDPSFVFSKSTDDFYNYRLGEGPIFGFQFVGNNLAEFSEVMDHVKDWIENPPVVEEPPPPAAPAPPSGGPGGPPPPPAAGPPPPPPPAQPIQSNPGGGLAAMLNAKKENLADSTVEKPDTAPASSGGDMMSELQKRLQRRSQKVETIKKEKPAEENASEEPAKPEPPKAAPEEPKKVTPSSIASGPKKSAAAPPRNFSVPSSTKKQPAEPPRKQESKPAPPPGIPKEEIELFKEALLTDFRAELTAIKTNIIETLQYEIAVAFSQ